MQAFEARGWTNSSILSLAATPLLLAATAGTMYGVIHPIYAGLDGYDYDPAYVYLFNGIGIIQGYPPAHVDHPGTPMQALSGIVAYLNWLLATLSGQTTLNFNDSVVANPELYISAISVAVLLLNVSAVFYLGLRLRAASGSLALAALAQGGFGLLGTLMPRLVYMSPEALTIFAAVMATACLADMLFSDEHQAQHPIGTAVATAFFLALAVTSKLTALPLVLLLAIIPSLRAKLVGAIGLLVFSVIFLSPVLSKLPSIWKWLQDILQHSGSYGTGPERIIEFDQLLPRLGSLSTVAPLLFVAIFAAFVATIGAIVQHRRRVTFCGAVLLVVLLSQLLMVLKHFGIHYILPSLVISPVVLVWALRRSLGTGHRLEASIATLGISLLLVVSGERSLVCLNNLQQASHDRDIDLGRMNGVLAAYPDATVIGAYRARNEAYAEQFGIGYVASKFQSQLAVGLREHISYNRWNGMLFRPSVGWVPLSYLNTIIGQGRVVLFVVPIDVQLPSVNGDSLLEIPGRERIIKVHAVLG